jgi:hypothetical protein
MEPQWGRFVVMNGHEVDMRGHKEATNGRVECINQHRSINAN